VGPIRRFHRQQHFAETSVGKQPAIPDGVRAAAVAPAGQLGQLDAEHRSLHSVDAEIGADQVMMVLRLHPVRPDQAQLLRQRRVAGGDEAGVAKCAEILAREK
jgi:hypothetical protein